ncbi:G-protein coupled receptor 179 [Trichomycterus rosablanca]|uniref:G-protein coupled receptor 179 n=1 Tax=Trichomycterus rosablanca TaxID=2290929 RepID=UPI002F360E17
MLLLLLMLSPFSAQISSSSDSWILSSLVPTPSVSNMSAITKQEIFARVHPQSVEQSSNVTVEKNEDGSMAMKYLYTNDDSLLTSSSCRQPFQLVRQQGAVPSDLQAMLSQVILSLTNTVNFLNLIFQASELRETSVHEDIEWYHALVRSMLVGERPGLVRHARLTFDADPKASRPQLVLQASRSQLLGIYLQDLTLSWKSYQLSANGSDPNWLIRSSGPPIPGLSKQVLVNDLSTLDTPKWAHGGIYVTNSSGLQWGRAPFLECKDGRLLPEWLLTLSMPFYGLKPDLSPEFRGVIQVDVNIQGFDVNQCITGDTWFADSHECNRTSMECEPIPGQGFRFGQYCCRCKEGYYSLPPDTEDQFNDGANSTQMCYPETPVCLPCWPGCKQCKNGSPCWVEEDWLLRAAMLAVQGFFMVLVLLLMLITYKYRRTRTIRAFSLLLLEIVLFGSVLLYFPVFILYFKPSLFRCILLRWVRLLGFTIVYGTVTLKMYRLLNVFLSCTAQRVLYMSNASVLRILGVMVLIAKWFLCAWTAGVLQNRDRNVPLLITSTTLDGQSFKMCDSDRWDYMMALAELLFLCWGSLLCSAVKSVPSAFHEPRYMGIVIHNELFFSAIFHLLRFMRTSVHPDWMLSLFFVHTHATTTVTLGLLFIPKFLHMTRPVKEDIASEMYEDEVDLHHSYIHLNGSFTSTCWNDHTLDPDDIRDELEKLYGRLEIQKTKKIAKNNPHLQKKRSSQLMLGQSLIKRIAEIPESMSRQCSRKDKDALGARGTTALSGSLKAIPESTCVTMRNEITKLPSLKIKTSQSACKYVPERDSLLINSSVKKCMERRASKAESIKTTPVKRVSKAESIDTAPVLCKSVSAHNLAVENNLLQPLPTRVQRSYSFSERPRDHYYLAHTESTKDTSLVLKIRPKDKSTQAQDCTKDTILNTEVSPFNFKEDQVAGINIPKQKQVTNSVSQQEPLAHKLLSSPSLLYVCPWEFASSLPPHPPVAEREHGMDSDVDSQRPKPPVSSSAPASPHGVGKPIFHRRFSFRSTTQTLILARGLIHGKRSGKCSDKKERTVCSTDSSGNTPQIPRRALTWVDSKPCLVKQPAMRVSSNDSTKGFSRSSAPPHICLCKSEDMIMEVGKPSPFGNIIQRQNSDTQKLSPTSSTESNKSTSHQIRSSLTVPRTNLCLWDVPNQTQPEIRESHIADICPLEFNKTGQIQSEGIPNHVSYWKTQMTADPVDICPWEALEHASRTSDDLRKKLTQDQGCIEANVCPCSVPVFNMLQNKPDSVKSPTTTRPSERIIYVDSCAGDKKIKSLVQQKTLRTDICPWETSEAMTDQKIISVIGSPWETGNMAEQYMKTVTDLKISARPSMQHPTKQPSSTADICPWDLPESPGLKNDCVTVCHWESEDLSNTNAEQSRLDVKKNTTMHLLTKQLTSTANICPWGFPELPPTVVDDCSSKSGEPFPKTKQETEGYSTQESTIKNADVCPWESEKPESLQEKCIAITVQKPENVTADICPWETETSSESTQSHSNTKCDICPWEQENSEESKMQESIFVVNHPWKRPANLEDSSGIGVSDIRKEDTCVYEVQGVRANRPLTRCDALCPWEIKSPSITEHDKNPDVLTWEEPIPEEGDAETAAEAFIFPPDL